MTPKPHRGRLRHALSGLRKPSKATRYLAYGVAGLAYLALFGAIKSIWYRWVPVVDFVPSWKGLFEKAITLAVLIAPYLGLPTVARLLKKPNWRRLLDRFLLRPNGVPRWALLALMVPATVILFEAGQELQPAMHIQSASGSIDRDPPVPGVTLTDVQRIRLSSFLVCRAPDDQGCVRLLPPAGYLSVHIHLKQSPIAAYRLTLTLESPASVGFAQIRNDDRLPVSRPPADTSVTFERTDGVLLERTTELRIISWAPSDDTAPRLLRVRLVRFEKEKEIGNALEQCWSYLEGREVDCRPQPAASSPP